MCAFFFSLSVRAIAELLSVELSVWFSPWQTLYYGWMDGWMGGWVDGWTDGGGGGGSVSLGGLAKWAESKWYRSTLADSEAPLIAFDQSGVEGPKPSSLPPPNSASLSPSANSIFSLIYIYLFIYLTMQPQPILNRSWITSPVFLKSKLTQPVLTDNLSNRTGHQRPYALRPSSISSVRARLHGQVINNNYAASG